MDMNRSSLWSIIGSSSVKSQIHRAILMVDCSEPVSFRKRKRNVFSLTIGRIKKNHFCPWKGTKKKENAAQARKKLSDKCVRRRNVQTVAASESVCWVSHADEDVRSCNLFHCSPVEKDKSTLLSIRGVVKLLERQRAEGNRAKWDDNRSDKGFVSREKFAFRARQKKIQLLFGMIDIYIYSFRKRGFVEWVCWMIF